jgi:hypothetical protein
VSLALAAKVVSQVAHPRDATSGAGKIPAKPASPDQQK